MSDAKLAQPRKIMPFEIDAPTLGSNGVLRAALRGHLDADGAARLQEFLEHELEKGTRYIQLDFAGVPFISSSGVGSLVSSVGEYRDAGGEIVLCRLSTGLCSVLKMLDLLDYITLDRN